MERFSFSTNGLSDTEAKEFWADCVLPQLSAQLLSTTSDKFICNVYGRRRFELSIGNYYLPSYSGFWKENPQLIGFGNSLHIFRVHRGAVKLVGRDGTESIVNAGATFLTAPEALYRYEIKSSDSSGPALIADLTVVPLKRLCEFGTLIPRSAAFPLRTTPTADILKSYIDALRSKETSDDDIIQLMDNFTELLAFTLSAEPDTVRTSTSLMHDMHYLRALELIRRCYKNPSFSLTACAQLLHISERTLLKAFECRELTFHQHLRDFRIRAAARRLRAPFSSSITAICFESGFNCIASFNRNFKAVFKMSPSEYRLKYFNATIEPPVLPNTGLLGLDSTELQWGAHA